MHHSLLLFEKMISVRMKSDERRITLMKPLKQAFHNAADDKIYNGLIAIIFILMIVYMFWPQPFIPVITGILLIVCFGYLINHYVGARKDYKNNGKTL